MIGRGFWYALLATSAISCGVVASASARPKRAKPSAPRPVATVRADSTAPAKVEAKPLAVSRNPGPTIRPGSPIEDRSTIVPFPIPGDSSRAAIERSKMMNVPRIGETLFGPPPRGTVLMPVDPMDLPPEQITPLAPVYPVYPKAARDAGIQGTVMVMAQVLADGSVGEARVVKSIPGLDEAAVLAVKQYRFRPARQQGKPVAMWVGVPVKFTLH